MVLNLNTLASKLKQKKPCTQALEGYTASAVLVPLILKGEKLHILYTHRTSQVRNHKNQISFPGGVKERQDADLLGTALRETEEEIGLPQDHVKVLGELRARNTPTRYHITPYVGLIQAPMSWKPNPQEIQEIIEIPLGHLMNDKNFMVIDNEFFGPEYSMAYYHYQGHTIWGATGRMTRELLELIGQSMN